MAHSSNNDDNRPGAIVEFICWALTLIIGGGSIVVITAAGYPRLAWVSMIGAALFLAGIWYLPERRGDGLPVTGVEYVVMGAGCITWLWSWYRLIELTTG